MNGKLQISAYTAVSALGHGVASHAAALAEGRSGLISCNFPGVELETWIGRVEGLEDSPVEGSLSAYDCRNNRLAMAALEQDGFSEMVAQARARYGADRIGVFLGTSTSGVLQTEEAYARANPETGALPDDYIYRTTQNIYSVASFTRESLKLEGPALVVSTACSSSAKVFATAWRHMQAGLCDAAIVGGVDSLCRMTLYGFNALQLVSARPCRPADQYRDGINIGEAGGYALLEWADDNADICLLGYGESSDAYHMSSPHPEGKGAAIAMQQALASAKLSPNQIDYINLHGTATPANDRSEDRGLMQVFNAAPPCSSTKGFTGHTLGAAGILEAVIACIAIEEGLLPPSLNTAEVDEDIRAPIVLSAQRQAVARVLSNSFGFGGSNASLVIGRRSV